MKVFVTVGTTDFTGLVKEMCKTDVQKCLHDQGYSSLLIQAGHTQIDTGSCVLKTRSYDYKSSILEDMRDADLVVSHAGAGTCLEALKLKKKLVVVINDSLMGNHQVNIIFNLKLKETKKCS